MLVTTARSPPSPFSRQSPCSRDGLSSRLHRLRGRTAARYGEGRATRSEYREEEWGEDARQSSDSSSGRGGFDSSSKADNVSIARRLTLAY